MDGAITVKTGLLFHLLQNEIVDMTGTGSLYRHRQDHKLTDTCQGAPFQQGLHTAVDGRIAQTIIKLTHIVRRLDRNGIGIYMGMKVNKTHNFASKTENLPIYYITRLPKSKNKTPVSKETGVKGDVLTAGAGCTP